MSKKELIKQINYLSECIKILEWKTDLLIYSEIFKKELKKMNLTDKQFKKIYSEELKKLKRFNDEQ